jgi:hypothetical protein
MFFRAKKADLAEATPPSGLYDVVVPGWFRRITLAQGVPLEHAEVFAREWGMAEEMESVMPRRAQIVEARPAAVAKAPRAWRFIPAGLKRVWAARRFKIPIIATAATVLLVMIVLVAREATAETIPQNGWSAPPAVVRPSAEVRAQP